MEWSYALVAAVVGTYLVAGLVKGAIGFGLPSIAIALMAIVMPPAQAAAILILPSFVTNVWQALAGPFLAVLLRRFWALLAASALGTWLGGGILTGDNARVAAFGLGAALICYGLVGLSGVSFSVRRTSERWLSVPVGLVTGLVTGATGVFVLPAGPYFQAVGLERDELVQMLGLSFTVSTVALAAVLLRAGVMEWDNTMGSLLAVLPALLGVAVGQAVRKRVSPAVFRLWFFAGLLLLGLWLAIRNAI